MESAGERIERITRQICPEALKVLVVQSAPLVHTYYIVTIEYAPEKMTTARIREDEAADDARLEEFVEAMRRVWTHGALKPRSPLSR